MSGAPFQKTESSPAAAVNSLSLVSCSSFSSHSTYTLQAGVTYRIQLGGASSGNFTVNFSAAAQAPVNDNFSAATAITALPMQFSGNTDAATLEPGEPTACSTAKTVW